MMSSKKPDGIVAMVAGESIGNGVVVLADLEIHGRALIVAQDVELHGAFVAKLLKEREHRTRITNLHAINLLEDIPVLQTDSLIETGRRNIV